jgi:SAM-dependent methyltransferase
MRAWDHNDLYHRKLLRHVPPHCDRALDVGCGTGTFAKAVARKARVVEGVDRAPEVIAAAKARNPLPSNVHYRVADVLTEDLGTERYDFISCLAVVHHMPFATIVPRLREALRPGGVLAVLGLYRERTATDYAVSLVAVPLNWLGTATFAVAGLAQTPFRRQRGQARERVRAPVAPPSMTLAEIRELAATLLPGVVIRRHLFWRYSLLYRRPDAPDATAS